MNPADFQVFSISESFFSEEATEDTSEDGARSPVDGFCHYVFFP